VAAAKWWIDCRRFGRGFVCSRYSESYVRGKGKKYGHEMYEVATYLESNCETRTYSLEGSLRYCLERGCT